MKLIIRPKVVYTLLSPGKENIISVPNGHIVKIFFFYKNISKVKICYQKMVCNFELILQLI